MQEVAVLAADDSALTPLLGLVGVALTAAITFATTWRWPTLHRRIQDHVALAKDLPESHRDPLLSLLDEEVAQLVARERRLGDDFGRFLRASQRVALTAAVATTVALLAIGLVAPRSGTHVTPGWAAVGLAVGAIGITACGLGILVSLISLGRTALQRRAKRKAPGTT